MTEGTTPAWLAEARARLGVRETPGPGSTAAIMGWARRLGTRVLGIAYGGDHTPWCGLFAAHCVAVAGLTPPKIAVRASSWSGWGRATTPRPGAVLVFVRPGGGHVGFYEGESADAYRVLGGNQGDAVSRAWIAKARCVAVRWPEGVAETGGPVWLARGGSGLSGDER